MLRKHVTGCIIASVIAYVVLTVVLVSVYGNALTSTMASVALVIVTAALVYATFNYSEAANKQAEAMNKQAQAQEEHVKATDRQVAALTEAVVFFGVEEFDTLMVDQLFVQNVGPGIAYDVNFEVIKDFEGPILTQNRKLLDLAFVKNPIKALAPGQKIPFAVIDTRNIKQLLKETIEVEVSYKNKLEAKEPFKQRFSLDFAYEEGMAQVRETMLKQLREISDSVKKIAKKFE